VKVLIVGLGSIGLKHVDALRKIMPSGLIYALRSGVNSNGVEGVISIYDLDKIPQDLDFIIISSPTFMHTRDISKCLAFNCPLFIEKPLFHQLGDAEDKVLSEIMRNKTITYVACNFRFHPVIQYVKGVLANKNRRINEINISCGSYLPNWRPTKNFREIYSSFPEMGGGVHLDLIHELDYVYWLFGPPSRVVSMKKNSSSLNIGSIDFASFILDYDIFAACITLNYYRIDTKRSLEIVFEDETWNCDLLTCKINSNSGDIVFEKDDYNIMDTYVNQLIYFRSQISAGQAPMNSIMEAREVLNIALHG